MEVTQENVEGVIMVVLHADRLEFSNSKDFRRAVEATIQPSARVILDLSQVRFIDSSGFGSLLGYLRQLAQAGGDLKLCGVTQNVRLLFQMICLHQVMDIFNTRQEAIRSYRI